MLLETKEHFNDEKVNSLGSYKNYKQILLTTEFQTWNDWKEK